MIDVVIDDLKFSTKTDTTIIEACKHAGITIPRFCYHETLSISGNCRMCLVEIEGLEKPVASCLTEVFPNICIYTKSVFVKKARENVLETLLLNHPLDCPICDQAGECDLQDQAKTFGTDYSRFFFKKRGVEDKDCGPFIKTIMTRCIHCTRCVRFGSEIAGIDTIGTLNRGSSTEIGGYISTFLDSEISGNVIDLCPVGALNSKPYSFTSRPWEMGNNESIDTSDSTCSNIYVNTKELHIARILPRNNQFINQNIISDKSRFSYDSNLFARVTHIDDSKLLNLEKQNTKKGWKSLFHDNDHESIFDFKKQPRHFIVDESIGFESLQFLKQQQQSFPIELSSPNSSLGRSNSYYHSCANTIKDIDSCSGACVLLSVNPKVECSVINSRLRVQTKNTLLEILTLNQFFNYNDTIRYINLNIFKSLTIFEGIYSKVSESFVQSKSPLLLLSDSINKKLITFTSNFLFYLKKEFNTLVNLKITSSSNKESLEYLNIDYLPYEKLRKQEKISNSTAFFFNIDDNFSFAKHYNSFSKGLNKISKHFIEHYYKFTSHYNVHQKDEESRVYIPTYSEFENNATFINLEGRPQKTTKSFPNFYDSRSFKTVLNGIFNTINKSQTYSMFFFEMVKKPYLFDQIKKIFSPLSWYTEYAPKNSNFLSHFPTKVTIQDFFLSNRMTKYSRNMQESSMSLRQRSSNFENIGMLI